MIINDSTELRVGDVVDERYEITRRIGRGGMGTVYEAQRIKLPRPVALKVLRPEYARKDTAAKRFEREAKAASSIEHRNVVNILDFGHLPSGELYYTMELLRGRDLSQLLRLRGSLPWSKAGFIVLQIVRAFAAIHARGIVHRDLKPANCFLMEPQEDGDPDYVKILDFGIANLQHEPELATTLTRDAEIIGSVRYMAPEQIDNGPIDARTDIYSLGIVMYELLTGQVPFSGSSAHKILLAHQTQDPRPVRQLVPGIPLEVEAIITKALAKAPEDRFQSMKEVEAALMGVIEMPGSPVARSTPSRVDVVAVPRPAPVAARAPWLRSALASVVLFGGAAGVTRWVEASRVDDGPPEVETELFEKPDLGSGPVIEVVENVIPPTQSSIDDQPVSEEKINELLADFKKKTSDKNPKNDPPWMLKPPGHILGTVRRKEGRDPIDARVCAWLLGDLAPRELRAHPRCTPTRNGKFVIAGLLPGLYDVHAFGDGFLPQSHVQLEKVPVMVLPGRKTKGLAFALEPGGIEIQGTVTDAKGKFIKNAKVAAAQGPRSLVQANELGAFSLWVAPQEPLHLVVWADGYEERATLARANEPLLISLNEQATVLGRVQDESTGAPVVGASVRAGLVGGIGVNSLAYTGKNGEFELAGLSPGSYQPIAWTDKACGKYPKPFSLEAGFRAKDIDIKLHAGQTAANGGKDSKCEAVEPPKDDDDDDDDDHDVSDGQRLRRLKRDLARCGTAGTVKVTGLILDTGRLHMSRDVAITGPAEGDPKVKKCVDNRIYRFRLNKKSEPESFGPLTVEFRGA